MTASQPDIVSDKDRKRLLPNAAMVAAQAVVTGLVLFVLYSFILRTLGVEALGLWSLVLATSSVGRVSEMGMSGCAVRYVSRHLANGDIQRAKDSLQTILITVLIMLGVFSLAIYPLLYWLLEKLLDGENLSMGRMLLPYALISLWCTGAAASAQAGLDGTHRAGLRAGLAMTASITMLIISILLVPIFGLLGLAYAQIIQAIFLFALNWGALRKILPGLPILPIKWVKSSFLEMWQYALNFQFVDLMNILTAPITKSLIGYFGDLSVLGYYEMAERMIAKVREMIVNANRVIVPYFSKLTETNSQSVTSLLRLNMAYMTVLAFIIMGGIAAIAPSISILWAGTYVASFTLSVWVLTIGWTATVISAPAYFAVLGSDDIRLISFIHALMMSVNIIAAVILGTLIGPFGPVIGWSLALIVMAIALLWAVYKQGTLGPVGKSLHTFFGLTIGTFIGIIAAWLCFDTLMDSTKPILLFFIQGSVFMLCLSPSLLLNPTFQSTLKQIFKRF